MTTDAHEQIPLIDTEALDDLREVLGDELDEIVEQFVAQLDEQVDAVREALAAADRQQVVESAHSLKGGAGNFGANRLAAIAAAIERAARDADLPGAGSDLASLLEAKHGTVARLIELGHAKPR